MNKNYDVIIVGARCAGATLAISLAEAGFQVLLLDRATFPSDTLTTNTFFNNTTAIFREIGVLDQLLETNVTPVQTIKFQFEDTVIEGPIPKVDGEDAAYSIRRKYLDHILLQHAKTKEKIKMIEGIRVTEVIYDGETVIGVRGEDLEKQKQEFRAQLVVGADGRNSRIRKLVNSELKISSPASTAVYYGYFSGIQHDSVPKFEVYKRKDNMAIFFPTNDELYVLVINFPLENKSLLDQFKTVPENSFRAFLMNNFPNTSIADRVKESQLTESIKGLIGYENYWYQGMGKGWALVGDAICFKDPAMAQGIHDAICGARILADKLIKNDLQTIQWEKVAVDYQNEMEKEFMVRFHMGCELSKNEPITEQQDMVNKIIGAHPSAVEKFLGIYNYANEPADFEEELKRIIASIS
ncbi:MAG TPA: NAD(P)/FAD-dependent oxidoreductase [Ureibacillus sp.]|uniref:NAD(P)/FAD-dependent oxidoreductase n=1 Tax=Peribacillus asahii TaxID=228899 RepID=UPI002079C22D|nr:NAD(P)/FAD-dependent oxidoreductase [Peribacillus asahii]USK59200.1 FAD-dependent monooxygenase [Peribacillus asahii]HWL26048.1 NAD(P)/FAD-dependent oxidoreductase [Ureibacillus sp.]